MSKISRLNGGVEIVCGCMFSGKSEEIIRRIRRAQIAGLKIQSFKHSLDTRYDAVSIVSHAGRRIKAACVSDSAGLAASILSDTKVVAIDGIQFFDPGIVEVITELADEGKRVICAGLDTDFRGEPFGPVAKILAIAEKVTKLQAICVVCHRPATRTQRIVNNKPAAHDDALIAIGTQMYYEARCRVCHEVQK